MSDTQTESTDEQTSEPKTVGVLARFAGPDELVAGARSMREKGYTKLEAYSPFPVHGIDEALAASKPILPFVVLGAGLTGMCVALILQYYTNAMGEMATPFSPYDFHISGKPAWSLPANIPVTFELIIAFSAFTSFLGMLAFNGLPRFYNPLFKVAQFLKATDDGFFLLADARDPKFNVDDAAAALAEVGGNQAETITDDPTPATVPWWIHLIGACTVLLALVPVSYIAMARASNSTEPRWTIWEDMDWQPKVKTQRYMEDAPIFADRRSMRLPVAGTVARGELETSYEKLHGYHADSATEEVVYLQDDGLDPDAAETTGDEPESGEGEGAESETPQINTDRDWVTEIPMPVTMDMMKRGKERYRIHCSACHGLVGDGMGLVHQRAASLEQPTWLPPTNFHQDYLRVMPIGQIYSTITNGKQGGKMAAYKEHIALEDRWAIALYVRALQRSQYASLDDLTEEERKALEQQ